MGKQKRGEEEIEKRLNTLLGIRNGEEEPWVERYAEEGYGLRDKKKALVLRWGLKKPTGEAGGYGVEVWETRNQQMKGEQ